MPQTLKKLITYLIRIVLLFIAVVVIYFLLAVVGSIIPVNRVQDSQNDIDIYIQTNGAHLDIVLPLSSILKDWTGELWIDSVVSKSAKYISFGWGDKEFFLNTQDWADMKLGTAFNALFLRSSSAMHIDYYSSMHINENCKSVKVNTEQYNAIVNFIENSFQKDALGNKVKIPEAHYNDTDCFYEAVNSYNLFYTCNTWSNKCLKEAGVKASLWTPFDRGILFHYRKSN